jgi:CarD family transcriptional regulator
VNIQSFKVGDKVVYPAHGVGVIEAIQSRIMSGGEQRYYMLTILESGMRIMVPVTQAKTVGLRRVVDAKTVEKVYDILRDRSAEICRQTWNRRYREYTQKIKTGSVFEIAKVIRDLSVLKSDKELSFGERKMLDTAQGLLVKEISIAKSRPEETVRAELQQICGELQ